MSQKDYFFDKAGDQRMEKQNQEHWNALIRRIDYAIKQGEEMRPPVQSLPRGTWDVLDIGCHTGGLLKMIESRYGFPAVNLHGVEPLHYARDIASHRATKDGGSFFENLEDVPDQSMDLIVSHETLYLVEDLTEWVSELKRILNPEGGAFIALGSHAENSAWMRWRPVLKAEHQHESWAHYPMEILDIGENLGFEMEVGPLHPETTYVKRYSPPEDGWGDFKTVEEMLEHRRKKLVFVFWPKQ